MFKSMNIRKYFPSCKQSNREDREVVSQKWLEEEQNDSRIKTELTISLFKNSFKSSAFLKTHLLYFILSLEVREIISLIIFLWFF